MPAPPTRASLFNAISKATANTKFGELYDYIVALLGASGNAADARTALGATTVGTALFTAVDAAAARKTAGVPNSGPLSGLRNLIINGNFSVNQRAYASGTAVGAANTYTLDRWRVVVSGQNASYVTSGAGRLVTAPAGGLEQVVEGASVGGGTYTINWTGTATCTVNGTARAKGATFALAAGSNATVRFSGGTVGDVQMEPGEVVTGFELRPVALEMMLCARYYCTADGEHKFDGSLGTATASTGATWFLPVNMRAAPTLSVQAESGSNAGAVASLVAKSNAAVFVTWEWQNGSTVVARNKAVVISASAEL